MKCIKSNCQIGKQKIVYGVSCVLPSEIYRGQCFSGKCISKVGSIAHDIIAYKSRKDTESLQRLQKIAYETIKKNWNGDVIIPVQPRNSKFELSKEIAQYVAEKMSKKYMDVLSTDNTKSTKKLTGLSVLIVDDVIFSGRTMKKALNAVINAGGKPCFYAIAKSKRYK